LVVDGQAVRVHLQAAVARGGQLGATPATHQGADAGLQLVQIKGLGQVVVRAGVQAQHAVAHRAARGEDEHWRVQALGAGLGQHLEAVAAGQAEVQHDHIGRAHTPAVQRAVAIGAGDDAHAPALEAALQRELQRSLVFDE